MAVKFATNVPQTLCFPFGDFMEVNGQYGQQFLYTVEVDGQRDKLYATPNLHDQLQADGMAPGSVLTITKVEAEGNRKDWLISPNGNGSPNPPDDPSRTDAIPRVSSDNGRPPPPDFSTMQELVTACLQASSTAFHSLNEETEFTGKDVRKLGISMFMECCRKGITPQLIEKVEGLEDEEEDALPF